MMSLMDDHESNLASRLMSGAGNATHRAAGKDDGAAADAQPSVQQCGFNFTEDITDYQGNLVMVASPPTYRRHPVQRSVTCSATMGTGSCTFGSSSSVVRVGTSALPPQQHRHRTARHSCTFNHFRPSANPLRPQGSQQQDAAPSTGVSAATCDSIRRAVRSDDAAVPACLKPSEYQWTPAAHAVQPAGNSSNSSCTSLSASFLTSITSTTGGDTNSLWQTSQYGHAPDAFSRQLPIGGTFMPCSGSTYGHQGVDGHFLPPQWQNVSSTSAAAASAAPTASAAVAGSFVPFVGAPETVEQMPGCAQPRPDDRMLAVEIDKELQRLLVLREALLAKHPNAAARAATSVAAAAGQNTASLRGQDYCFQLSSGGLQQREFDVDEVAWLHLHNAAASQANAAEAELVLYSTAAAQHLTGGRAAHSTIGDSNGMAVTHEASSSMADLLNCCCSQELGDVISASSASKQAVLAAKLRQLQAMQQLQQNIQQQLLQLLPM